MVRRIETRASDRLGYRDGSANTTLAENCSLYSLHKAHNCLSLALGDPVSSPGLCKHLTLPFTYLHMPT